METLIILLALATVVIPALTEAAVVAPHLFAVGNGRGRASRHDSERLGSEKLADL
jgi:hypothetical protein